jgi:hypothetical protein
VRELPAHPLPALQRARLEYLFEASSLLAKDWPWMSSDETCVYLLAPLVQWVVNCAEAPAAGFSRLEENFRGRPVFMRRGGTFDAAGKDLSTQELLARMPAAAHVDEPGAQNSDLPSRHAWLLLGSLEGLMQYHAAFKGSSTEEWLSVAMHEFFHTRQLRLASFATSLHLINTRELDAKPLAALYVDDARYRALVRREYELLVNAARASVGRAQALQVLRSWYALYRKRRANLAARPEGAKLVQSDCLFTYVEGVARYVESTFLIVPDQHPSIAIPGDARFDHFARWENRGYAAMPNRQLDTEYYYAIGFHLGLLLDRVDPTWKRAVHEHDDWLIGSVQRSVAGSARRGSHAN